MESAQILAPGNNAIINIAQDLDISSLQHGLHIIHFRVKNTNGKWGPVVSGYFVYKKSIQDLGLRCELRAKVTWLF